MFAEWELLIIVVAVCWLICSWRLVIPTIYEIYMKGWRGEMKKVKEEYFKAIKDTFGDDDKE